MAMLTEGKEKLELSKNILILNILDQTEGITLQTCCVVPIIKGDLLKQFKSPIERGVNTVPEG